jgi:CRP-like cAMP-binding protein
MLDKRRQLMFQVVKYETFSDGKIIFKEGTFGDWLYIVDEGAVEISRRTDEKKIVIAILQPGEILGEVAYISKGARSATATAVGKTIVGIIDRNSFDHEFNMLSSDFQMILKTLASRLKTTTDSLMEIQK